jgi:integrase
MTPLPRPFEPSQENPAAAIGTVQEIIDHYLFDLARRVARGDYSAHAFQDSERELRAFAKAHGTKSLDRCRRHDLTEWLDAHPQWKSNWTRKRVLATLCRPFIWAADEELISASPYRVPRSLRLPTRPRREASTKEYILLMRHASRALRRALFFLHRTGARTCEMREVLWTDVDLGRGIVRLDEHKTMRTQRNPAPRIIGLDEGTVRFLKNLLRQRPARTEKVFLNNDGTPWTRQAFARCFRRAADRLGLAPDLSAYCLRHLYGTEAIEGGVGERQLADQMGHTTTRMVSYYAKTAGKIDHLRRVATQVKRSRRKS